MKVLPEVVLGMNVKGLYHKYGIPIVSIHEREAGVVQQGLPTGNNVRLGGVLEFIASLELDDFDLHGEGAVYFADVCNKLAKLMLVRKNKRRGMDDADIDKKLEVVEDNHSELKKEQLESKENSHKVQ